MALNFQAIGLRHRVNKVGQRESPWGRPFYIYLFISTIFNFIVSCIIFLVLLLLLLLLLMLLLYLLFFNVLGVYSSSQAILKLSWSVKGHFVTLIKVRLDLITCSSEHVTFLVLRTT